MDVAGVGPPSSDLRIPNKKKKYGRKLDGLAITAITTFSGDRGYHKRRLSEPASLGDRGPERETSRGLDTEIRTPGAASSPSDDGM